MHSKHPRALRRCIAWMGQVSRRMGVAPEDGAVAPRPRRVGPERARARPLFETVEQRLLMSADLLPAPVVQTVASPPAAAVANTAPTWTIGQAGNGSASQVVLTDADGTRVTFQLRGPGSATITADGGGFAVALTGSGLGTSLTLRTDARGDGLVRLTGLTSNASVGAVDASSAMLTGAMAVQGQLVSLRLRSVESAGAVAASAIANLEVAGQCVGSLRLSGPGLMGASLGAARIGGVLDGQWNVQGGAGAVAAASIRSTWFGSFTGQVLLLATSGNAGGTLATPSLLALQVGGSLVDASYCIGARLGTDGAFGGTGSAADQFGGGALERLRVTGQVQRSVIRIGVLPTDGVFDNGNDAVSTAVANPIRELSVGGRFTDSTVIASRFPATVRVGGANVSPGSVAALSTSAIDRVAPVVSVRLADDTGASAADGVTRDASITGTVLDAGSVAGLWLRVTQGGVTGSYVDASASLDAGSGFELSTAAIEQLTGRALADGPCTIDVRATDRAGNAATVSVAFVLDRRPPQGPAFGLAQGSDTGAAGDGVTELARVVLTGTTTAGATLRLLETGAVVQAGSDGTFRFADVALALGANTCTVVATDLAGNTSQGAITLERVVASDAVSVWNTAALEAIRFTSATPPYASRALAMQSVAVFDALSAIRGTAGFLVSLPPALGASMESAVVAASHGILSVLFPSRASALDALRDSALGAIADGAAKTEGVGIGLTVANALLGLRSADGSTSSVGFAGSPEPGLWRPTPPGFAPALLPQWATLTPFALASPGQFRPAGPPALTSAQYAEAFEDVKTFGARDSVLRTADQSQTALFWADGAGTYTPPGHWNQIAGEVAGGAGLDLLAKARLFAQLNVALADAAIGAWDAKYAYGSWRPVEAIRRADVDGNAATTADAAWTPFIGTPPHPDYVSGHSSFSAAAAVVLTRTFGTVSFQSTTFGLPGVVRQFSSFEQAAQEAGRSRIYGGIHFQFANTDGLAIGQSVGEWTMDTFASRGIA